MSNSHPTEYSRYFAARQKVFLINMSEERDKDQYESLSSLVVSSHMDGIDLQIPYPVEQEPVVTDQKKITYKLTTESFGVGVQVIADLVSISAGNIFHLQLRGTLEIYQRRSTPRVDANVSMLHFRRNFSITYFRKEWKRVVDYMKTNGLPPKLTLQKTRVNLSMGGIRLTSEDQTPPSALSMFFIDVSDGTAPVCAVAEAVWSRSEGDHMISGYRFIHILKADQERIKLFVENIQKGLGIATVAQKTNWDLLDRMSLDIPAPKS